MALTNRKYTGDSITTQYPIDFDLGYLNEKSYIYVYLEGNEPSNQLSYSWVNTSQIELDTPVPSGQVFNIRRIIPRDELVNDYTDGAILREKNLDNSFLQALMIVQEIQDGWIEPDTGEFLVNTDINLLGNKVINSGEPELPADLTTKNYVDSAIAVLQEFSEKQFVNVSGDTMTSQLHVPIEAQGSNTEVLSKWQICRMMDKLQRDILDHLEVPISMEDFRYILEDIVEFLDDGLIVDPITESIDDKFIIAC